MTGITNGSRSSGRAVPTALALAMALFTAWPAAAQETAPRTRVAVLPVSTAGLDSSYALVAKVAGDTAFLTLQLLGQYDVTRWDAATLAGADPYALAEERRMDDLMLGAASLDERGRFTIEMSVWSRAEGRVTHSEQRTAESVFGIFDAAEQLIAALVGAFSGSHIGFGSLLVGANPPGLPFTVMVDGTPVGEGVERVDGVLNGIRRIEIVQDRLLGRRIIASATVAIVEEDEAEFSFEIPYLTEEESAHLSRLEEAVDRDWHDPAAASAVRETLDQAIALFMAATCRGDYGPETRRFINRRTAFELLVERRALASLARDAGDGAPGRFDADSLFPQSNPANAPELGPAFRQLCLVGATAAFLRRDADAVEAFRLAAERSAVRFPRSALEGDADEYRYMAAALAETERSGPRGGIVTLGISSAALGALGGAFSALAFALDLPGTLRADADSIYAQYLNARDAAEIARLRDELGTATVLANLAEVGKWAGLGLFAAAVPVGILMTGGEMGRAGRVYEERGRFVDSPRVMATEALAGGAPLSPRRTLVLSEPSGAAFRLPDGRLLRTPFVLEAPDGLVVLMPEGSWFEALPLEADLAAAEGLLFLDLSGARYREPAPAAPAVTTLQGGKSIQYSWEPQPGASSYLVEVRRTVDGVEAIERLRVDAPPLIIKDAAGQALSITVMPVDATGFAAVPF